MLHWQRPTLYLLPAYHPFHFIILACMPYCLDLRKPSKELSGGIHVFVRISRDLCLRFRWQNPGSPTQSFSINSANKITQEQTFAATTMRAVKLFAVFTILAALFAVTWPVPVLGRRLGRGPPTPRPGPPRKQVQPLPPWLQHPPPPPPPRHRQLGLGQPQPYPAPPPCHH
jgi:hypothetical protein